jgi:branched-chain amino acid transport system substrate-binding protein
LFVLYNPWRRQMKKLRFLVLISLVALFATPALAADTIKIGFNIPLTGDIPKVGEMSKQAAEMLKEDVNGAGGLAVGGKKYMLEFVYEDNEAKAESAVTTALKLIEKDEVLAMIGPNSSKQAVPAGQVANDNETVMVTPWSTNPDIIKDRPWVFRAAFLDPFQGPVPSTLLLRPSTQKLLLFSTICPMTTPKGWPKSSNLSLRRRWALTPYSLSRVMAPRTKTSVHS